MAQSLIIHMYLTMDVIYFQDLGSGKLKLDTFEGSERAFGQERRMVSDCQGHKGLLLRFGDGSLAHHTIHDHFAVTCLYLRHSGSLSFSLSSP